MQNFSPLLQFYANQTPDTHGRYIEDIWAFSHQKLEYTHNFIQWIFPLEVMSRYHPSPILTKQDRLDFAHSDLLKQHKLKSLDVMLDFWGMMRDGVNIIEKGILTKKEYAWLKPHNHNQLRMTRTIHSLALCDQPELALSLQQALLSIADKYGNVSPKIFDYWLNATSVPSLGI